MIYDMMHESNSELNKYDVCTHNYVKTNVGSVDLGF